MTTLKRALVTACVFSQFISSQSAPKVRRGSTQTPEELSSTVPTTGAFVFRFNITVASPLPKNGIVVCQADADVSESSTNGAFEESAAGFATFVSGHVWTCTATMHYSWPLSTPSMDQVNLNEEASIIEARAVTATNANATTVTTASVRQSARSGGTLASVPLTGSTTVENVSVRL